MTLFTACGLLSAQENISKSAYSNHFDPDTERKHSICSAYFEWYYTQIGKLGKRPRNCWIRELTEITHKNPLGYIPAAMMVHIIYRLATDPAPTRDALYAYTEEAMKTMDILYPAHASSMEYMRMLVKKAFTFAASDLSDNEAVELIGGGWVGDEALAIALYCAAKHFDDF